MKTHINLISLLSTNLLTEGIAMNCLLQSFKTFVKRYQHLVEKYFVTCVQMVLIQGRPLFPNNVLRYYQTFLRMVKFIFYINIAKHDIFVYLNLVLCSGYRFCIFLLFLRLDFGVLIFVLHFITYGK